MQDEIARTIAEKLKSKLAGGGQRPLVQAPTRDLEAYQLYLQGRFHWLQRGAGLMRALPYFDAALARDPNFALVYAGIADTHVLQALYGSARPSEIMPKARSAVERALVLEPDLAEAHCALGFIRIFYERDTRAARQSFQRAIELKPSYATSYSWYAAVLSARAQFEQAPEMSLTALRAEPLSLPAGINAAWTLIYFGRSEEAVARAQRVIELDPKFFPGYWVLGQALICRGHVEEGIEALRKSVEHSHRIAWMVATLGCGLVCGGQSEEARRLLHELTCRMANEYVPAFALAMLEAFLGEEAAFAVSMERAIADGDAGLALLRNAPGPIAPMAIPAAYLSAAKRAVYVERLGLNRE